jgi:hypothetical protein
VRLAPSPLEGAHVREHVRPVLLGDERVAPPRVEPLHGSRSHGQSLSLPTGAASAHETAGRDERAAKPLVQRAERGSVVDRQHGGAFAADAPWGKTSHGGPAQRDQLVICSSGAPVAHGVPRTPTMLSGGAGWIETAEMLSGERSSRWTARCSPSSWVHRAPHRLQKAGRRALTAMTT